MNVPTVPCAALPCPPLPCSVVSGLCRALCGMNRSRKRGKKYEHIFPRGGAERIALMCIRALERSNVGCGMTLNPQTRI